MNKIPPEIIYVVAEESADGESRVNRAFDVIFKHLLEQYRIKTLKNNQNTK